MPRGPLDKRAALPRLPGRALALVVLTGASLLAATQSGAQRVAPCTGGPALHNVVAPVLPRTFKNESVQPGSDCLAWQEFIYLNWPADPARAGRAAKLTAAAFGTPGDSTPTVWQTYLEASAVFDPPPGGRSGPSAAGAAVIDLRETDQSGGGWLTSRAGNLTYYEVRLNPDEVEYIRDNKLTTFAGQAACVQGKGGLNLPHGGHAASAAGGDEIAGDTDCDGISRTYGQNIGAIEIKAAWTVLPADGSLDYRYKIARAMVTDPATGKSAQATVGLVGLHIVRKLPGAAQFLWATFEQVDNAPDEEGLARPGLPAGPSGQLPARGYTYFDAACAPDRDPSACAHNARPAAACRRAGLPPLPACRPYSAPVQVTRLTPITAEVNDATAEAWAAIQRERPPGSPSSVFNYYRLIDVQWPAQDVPPVSARATIPLPADNMIPTDSTRYVANTTMETFVQQEQSCLDCHQNAAIAHPEVAAAPAPALDGRTIRKVLRGTAKPTGAAPLYASDYSFVFAAHTRH